MLILTGSQTLPVEDLDLDSGTAWCRLGHRRKASVKEMAEGERGFEKGGKAVSVPG